MDALNGSARNKLCTSRTFIIFIYEITYFWVKLKFWKFEIFTVRKFKKKNQPKIAVLRGMDRCHKHAALKNLWYKCVETVSTSRLLTLQFINSCLFMILGLLWFNNGGSNYNRGSKFNQNITTIRSKAKLLEPFEFFELSVKTNFLKYFCHGTMGRKAG